MLGRQGTYVDGPEACTMPGRHVLIKALNSICPREFTELLVHVVGSRARVVSQPDAKVFDLQRLLFVDLQNRGSPRPVSNPIPPASWGLQGTSTDNTYNSDTNDLAAGLLDLFQLPGE